MVSHGLFIIGTLIWQLLGGDALRVQNQPRQIGVFVQIDNATQWKDLHFCLQNIENVSDSVDLYFALTQVGLDVPDAQDIVRGNLYEVVRDYVSQSRSIHNFQIATPAQLAAGKTPFVAQLSTLGKSLPYDYILQLKLPTDYLQSALRVMSMCGSVHQVQAILHNFELQPGVGVITQTGTITANGGSILEQFANQTNPEQAILDMRDNGVASGAAFWARTRAVRPVSWAVTSGILPVEASTMPNLSLVLAPEWGVATVAPAPKVIAVYFPQYHEFPENDRFWGRGFTEWTLMKKCNKSSVHRPLPVEDGGLGMYDLTDFNTRLRQGQLAREYGIHGFLIYHYWFVGEGILEHQVMQVMPEKMLADGAPFIPFMFSWANEPWNRRWNGVDDGEYLLPQDYGEESDWLEHFEYLLPFFRHPRYIRTEGKPGFVVYRLGHLGEKAWPMMVFFRKKARESGFPGMDIIATFTSFYESDLADQPSTAGAADAAFHFVPTCQYHGCGDGIAATAGDLEAVHEPRQYWGAYTGFSNVVRGGETTFTVSPAWLNDSLHYVFNAMGTNPSRQLTDNLYFIAAWNEWNEQNTIEPDTINEFGFLEAIRDAITRYAAPVFGAVPPAR